MNKLTDKPMFWILLLSLLLLPFLLLSFFCHPSADDYIISSVVRDSGISAHFHQTYTEWSGRYFSTIIACFNPLVYGWIGGYKIIPLFLMLLFYCSVYYFFLIIFQQSLASIKKHLASLFITILFFNNMPSTSEGIYWMSSSLNYFLSTILLLFFFSLTIKTWYKGKSKASILILLFLLPVMIVGSNEISMLFLDELLFFIIIAQLIRKKKIEKAVPACRQGIIFPAAVAFIATIVKLSAPGNYMKMGFFPMNTDIWLSIQKSIFSFLKISGTFLKDPAFILGSMIFISFLPTLYKNEIILKLINFSPFVVFPLSILILVSLYFPVAFSTGVNPALRIHNTVGFIFVFIWFYNLTVLHYFFLKRKKIEMIAIPVFLVKLLGAGAIILIVSDFNKEPGKDIIPGGNIFRAGYDLFMKAPAYNHEMYQRYEIMEQKKKENELIIEVPALTHIPTTIHFIDIITDSSNWVNLCMAQYFKLRSIKTKNTSGYDIH